VEQEARKEQDRLQRVADLAKASEISLTEDADGVRRVAQAAVLRQHNKEQAKEQADAQLEGLSEKRVPRSLEAANTFKEMANWNLGKERWETAAARFNILGYLLTSVDNTSDREGISFDMLSVTTALSLWGEPGQYDHMRGLMLERFAKSENPIIAEHVLKATLLEPANEKFLQDLQPLARMLETSLDHPQKDESTHMVAWRQFSLAIMAYREGAYHADRFEEAANRARLSMALEPKSEPKSEPRMVSNQAILAMVDLKQGRLAEARSSLKELRKKADRWLELPFQVINQDKTLWYNQHAALILLREAEGLLDETDG
jgi:hypothetical protein